MPTSMRSITLLIAILVPFVASPSLAQQSPAAQQRAFATPETAMEALVQAIRAPTTQPLEQLIGKEVMQSIPPEERNSDTVRRAAGERLASKAISIVYEDDARTRARAVIGEENFRMPMPLVRTARGWIFDGKAAIAEMRERRAGVNEANAIEALRAFAQAQRKYYERDRNGDGVLEYAQRIRGTPGQLDGLVNHGGNEVPGFAISLLNEAFARAEMDPAKPIQAAPGGYAYRVLTAQGANADGGARSYLVNGRMTEGFAIVAWPARAGESGLSTFIMDHRGSIFEQEFGAQTLEAVRKITTFDPESGWTPVKD